MPGLLTDVDPDGLLEYSVVYTDRAVNHMSGVFQGVIHCVEQFVVIVYIEKRALAASLRLLVRTHVDGHAEAEARSIDRDLEGGVVFIAGGDVDH